MSNSTTSASISDINGTPEIPQKIALRIPKILTNLLIFICSYIIFYFIKKQSFVYDHNYLVYIPVYFTAWGLGGVISGKFRFHSYPTINAFVYDCYISLLFSLGTVAFLLNQFESISLSRMFVVGSLFTGFVLEILIYSFQNRIRIETFSIKNFHFSILPNLLDLILLTWVLFFLFDEKIKYNDLIENQFILIAGTYISWFLSGAITHQFKTYSKDTTIWSAISTHLKFYLLFLALMSFVVYILQVGKYYQTLYLTAIFVYSVWSFILMLFFYIDKLPERTDDITTSFLHAFEIKDFTKSSVEKKEFSEKYSINGHKQNGYSVPEKLKYIYFRNKPELFEFLDKNLEISSFEIDKISVLSSRDPFNITVFPNEYLELFINLHKLNDIRRINQYFIEVNNRLRFDGVFVGNFEPIRYRYERFRKKYPFVIANVLYLADFLWKRAAPKLPIVRRIYFALTKGNDRALPLAEGLGRLYYCGFEVIDLKVINNLCYFVAKKVKLPSTDKNPSYSPLIKMKRHGKNGKLIYVYKFRTMHPYSEYLQEFVYNYNKLDVGGKFKDDFRITKWGTVLRKLWIDELPMLINFFRGDLKLVGVRPLSEQYLSLYDAEFRNKRYLYKPGLIPPYYVDLPKSINKIVESEKKYLNEFDKNKFKTDLKYFLKAVNNIVFNHARSR